MTPAALRVLLAAMALMALAMGTRTAAGLFVSPLNTATGVGLAGLGFAIALGQLAQGLAQPPLGALADRFGSRRLIVAGAIVLTVSTAALAVADSVAAFAITFVVIAVASSAVGSNSLLLAEVGRRMPPERRATAFALVGAGGSAGQLLLAPATQFILDGVGWVAALLATAVLSLVALPLARLFDRGDSPRSRPEPVVRGGDIGDALRTPAFWGSAGSFGICGFHIGFLTTHMPGVIERCGLNPAFAGVWLAVLGVANIAGSLAAGVVLRHVSTKTFLIAIFALRAATVMLLFVMPATPELFLCFAVLMGLSYMALLPAISQQVAGRFGVERLATLFGFVALVHQVGSFAGVWLGGIVAEATGHDALTWMIDIGLAGLAITLQCLATSRVPVTVFLLRWRSA
jgi:predicted MFS family arabinose efflux permease